MSVRIPKLSYHKPTDQCRINSQRFRSVYFGVNERRAKAACNHWVDQNFVPKSQEKNKPDSLFR